MRHFLGPPPIKVSKTSSGYDVIFENSQTGEQIKMSLPRSGIFEDDPTREITTKEVKELSKQIVEVLDTYLD